MRLLIIAASIQAAILSWVFYAWQPYFMELLHKELVWVAGVMAALLSLSTMIGNGIVEYFTRFCGRRTTLLLWGVFVQAMGAVSIGLTSNFYLASASLLFVTGAMGMMGPVRQAYIHAIIPSAQRATTISFDSMISGMGSSGGQAGLGYLAQVRSYSSGYLTGGIILAMAFPVILLVRHMSEKADIIVGKKAGVKGGCPAQGIPNISGLDSSVQ